MRVETIISELKHELWCMPNEPPEDCDYPEEWLCVNKNIREAKEGAIELLEKQISKQWDYEQSDECDIYICPCCKERFFLEWGTPKDNEYNYCPTCGQRLEWE